MPHLPASIVPVLFAFAPLFTAPTWWDTRDRPRNSKTSDYSLQPHEAHEPVQNDIDLGLGQSSDRGAAELGTADGAAVFHQGRWGDAGTPTSSNRIHAENSRPRNGGEQSVLRVGSGQDPVSAQAFKAVAGPGSEGAAAREPT
jgi:hypothetical protein